MRSGLVAALMGIGGIFVSFGAVVLVLAFFARTGETHLQLPAMASLATGTLVVGGVMFVLGFLLNRVGRKSADRVSA